MINVCGLAADGKSTGWRSFCSNAGDCIEVVFIKVGGRKKYSPKFSIK
jgi:hypothetical protein